MDIINDDRVGMSPVMGAQMRVIRRQVRVIMALGQPCVARPKARRGNGAYQGK